jgi:DNA-binding transcriptional regulator YhcF (GntR family)
MDFAEHIPIYLQIEEYVKVLIITGEAKPGDKLPAVREMAGKLGINPNTVQKAYQALEATGIIKGERGSGNYITEDAGIIRAIQEELSGAITDQYIQKMKKYGLGKAEILKILTDKLEETISENT